MENLVHGSQNYLFRPIRESELPFCVSQNYLLTEFKLKSNIFGLSLTAIAVNGSSDLHLAGVSAFVAVDGSLHNAGVTFVPGYDFARESRMWRDDNLCFD